MVRGEEWLMIDGGAEQLTMAEVELLLSNNG